MALVIDMNLSVEWVEYFRQAGISASHWSRCGAATAPDTEIMRWALERGQIVFTHDLDFGAVLALTHATGPSVFQIRGSRVLPEHIGSLVLTALRQYEADLERGAIVVVEPTKSRVRILPF
ncbi:MAG: DUF5615 family PIN-like protein [Planctomycetia bacterium]|nr:DUF5615 family PIN-like protein [Planctomycetia bacterium]